MNFLGMGPMELFLILILALIVFGPGRLPEIMGQIGRAVNEFRKTTSELSGEFNRTLQAEIEQTRAAVEGREVTPPPLPPPSRANEPAPPAATDATNGVADEVPPAFNAADTWSWETSTGEKKPVEPEAAGPPSEEQPHVEAEDKPSSRTAADSDILPPY